MFHQTNDAELFLDREELLKRGAKQDGNRWKKGRQVFLPLYEAKMVQAYDHRAAGVVIEKGNWMRQGQTEPTTPVFHQNPEFVVQPRWWVESHEVDKMIGENLRPVLSRLQRRHQSDKPTNHDCRDDPVRGGRELRAVGSRGRRHQPEANLLPSGELQ